jgi:hypothetical protein
VLVAANAIFGDQPHEHAMNLLTVRAIVPALALVCAIELHGQTYETGRTYRFTLNLGASKTARVLGSDSTSLFVIAHNDTDAEFIPYSQIALAEEVRRRDNMITFSGIGLFIGTIAPTYYRRIDDGVMLGGGPRYHNYSKRLGGLIEARIYTAENAPYGFYFAPNIGFLPDFQYPFADGDYPDDAITAGIVLGWQWFTSYRFGLGFGFSFDGVFALENENADRDVDPIGPLVMYRGDIAYAW